MAIIRFGGGDRKLVTRPLRRDRLVLAVPARTRRQPRRTVDLADFADEPWIWLPRNISPTTTTAGCGVPGVRVQPEHSALGEFHQLPTGDGRMWARSDARAPHLRDVIKGITYLSLRSPVHLVELALVRRRGAGRLADHLADCTIEAGG